MDLQIRLHKSCLEEESYLEILKRQQLKIALHDFIRRYEEKNRDVPDIPMPEVMLYSAAKQYLNATL